MRATRDQTYLVYVSDATASTSLKIFSPYYNWPVYKLNSNVKGNWLAMCIIGREGIKGIYPVNVSGPTDKSVCSKIQK